jgi:cysteine desulfuration protein SufE
MKSIEEKEKEIIEDFELFGDNWEEKYEHIIDLGKRLPALEERFKDDQHLIKGCQSKVWMKSELREGGLWFSADSDAIITKGIIALLIQVLNGQSPAAIAKAPMTFIETTGLSTHLSPTRANGLLSMIRQMKLDAIAHMAKTKND